MEIQAPCWILVDANIQAVRYGAQVGALIAHDLPIHPIYNAYKVFRSQFVDARELSEIIGSFFWGLDHFKEIGIDY